MKRVLIHKCRDRSGETIAETLLALLISTLAITMLAGAITTASKLADRSDEVLQQYYAVMNTVARAEDGESETTYEKGNGFVSVYTTDAVLIDLLTGVSADPKRQITYRVNKGFEKQPIVAYNNNAPADLIPDAAPAGPTGDEGG